MILRPIRRLTPGRLIPRHKALAASLCAVVLGIVLVACSGPQGGDPDFDVVVRGGTIYDGSGEAPREADVGILLDRIAEIGDLASRTATLEIDATGMAVSPGFINMLSWATESLILDGRSQSDLRQGVTLEVFGEGVSMGPLSAEMKDRRQEGLDRLGGEGHYEIDWNTLGEYLEWLENRGVATNVASFIGATTVRVHELGYEDRVPTAEELERMRGLVRQAMEEGALGVGSSLIYAPAFYASTEELIELCRVAAEYDGMYISHMRSEGNRLIEAVDELLRVAREAEIRAEIYHLKAAGAANWSKMEAVIARVEEARAAGLEVTADMYTYPAGATGLDASMPPWVQEGGHDAWLERLRDPAIRSRVEREMITPTDEWENLYLVAGGPDNILLVGFENEDLRGYVGKTLAEVASERGVEPQTAAIDLVLEDDSRVETVYFMMSEENIERQIALPWVSFGSDAGSLATEGIFIESMTHPRAYGNFARLLGHYVRERSIISLPEAIRRLTSLPAENLRIRDRGRLAEGYYADVVVFDPATVSDHATFADPHQYSTGVRDVLVNGTLVLEGSEPTGATPGRVVRGPGWAGFSAEPSEAVP